MNSSVDLYDKLFQKAPFTLKFKEVKSEPNC